MILSATLLRSGCVGTNWSKAWIAGLILASSIEETPAGPSPEKKKKLKRRSRNKWHPSTYEGDTPFGVCL